MITRLTGWIMDAAKVTMSVAFAVMIFTTLLQIVNRYAFNFSIFWTEELIVMLLVWATLLGLPVQLWRHEEILVDIIELPAGWMRTLKAKTAIVSSIVFCAALAWTGMDFAMRGLPVVSPALGISRFWFFLPIPLSAALAILALLVRPPGPSIGGYD
ncbi:TRAP transporter small permease subunit [Devosia sp. 2618]|uniref:TRAP transporter small permease n=1 Tax=Devosia sp. 2618 TaxID=3156454 RepID=UPI003392C572